MSKSSKSRSPAQVEQRRKKRAQPDLGRSAIVKASLRIDKFHPWAVGCLCAGLVFGVLFVLGERNTLERTLLDILRVLAILSMAAAGVIAVFLLKSWYKAEQVDGFKIWEKGSLEIAVKNATISDARRRS